MPNTRPSFRWITIAGLLLAAVIFIPVIVLFTLFVVRENPGPQSLDDAIHSFRSQSETSVKEPETTVIRPAAGVYGSVASGTASISFPATSQKYGNVVPVTVTHTGANCWSTSVDFNSAYQQRWDYCFDAGYLVENGNYTSTRWDFGVTSITNRSSFICQPPGRIMKASEDQSEDSTYTCLGTSDSIDGTTTSEVRFTFIGHEALDIDSVAVPTIHYQENDTLTGAQRGSTSTDYWYSVNDLLLVRMERHLELRTDSPIGDITYTEDGQWKLSSILPNR